MELIPIKTRRVETSKDDLFVLLDEFVIDVRENDVLVVASKIVAIHEGRCVPSGDVDAKQKLVEQESDYIIPTPTQGAWDITVKNNMISFAGGIDESNVGDYLLLLPENPTQSAIHIRQYLVDKYNIENVGVIISDSTALPYRQGTIAISIGHAGFKPVNDKVGTLDLYGRPFSYTYVNIVDPLAIAAGYVMGETDESTPFCIVRDIPHITFTNEDFSADLLIKPEDDVFYPLLKGTYKD